MAHIQDRRREHDRRWQARYRDPEGRERSKSFTRKVDAQRWLDQVTTHLVTGRYIDPNAGRVTLADFATQWLETQTYDASTRETMESRVRTHILPTIGDMELRHLKPVHRSGVGEKPAGSGCTLPLSTAPLQPLHHPLRGG